MADRIEPQQRRNFMGLYLRGNPIERLIGTAAAGNDFRIMPDFWLRLRSGRKARLYNAAGNFYQFHNFRSSRSWGYDQHLVQEVDGSTVYWRWLAVTVWTFDPFFQIDAADIEIDQNYGGDWTTTETAPILNINDRSILYNGLGVRNGSTFSKPPFWSWDGTDMRNFGLDCYAPSSNPSVAFAAGAGFNQSTGTLKIYVGLYNTDTGHFSNGILCGSISSTGGTTGTITVSNLDRLKTTYIDTDERNELKFVFYATIQGGETPYLLLNAALNDAHQVAVTETTASLSIYNGGNGWVKDFTSEMQIDNHPPRPMRSMAYINQRVYGVLAGGGSGSGVVQERPGGTQGLDFTYIAAKRYRQGLVYSKSASDLTTNATLIGNPEESWPLTNFTACPSAEEPLRVSPAPDGVQLVVNTATRSFLVTEAADGYHQWTEISAIHGIANKDCYIQTDHGAIWLTQRNQVVRHQKGWEHVSVISDDYEAALYGLTPRFMSYLVDPLNEIDQARVYFTDGTLLIHDFKLRTPQQPDGMGYLYTSQDYTAASTVMNTAGQQQHIIAKQHIYTIEGQADESGDVVTYDESYVDVDNKTQADITGYWEGQWDDLGDGSLVKQLSEVDVFGDEQTAIEWYADHEPVTADKLKRGQQKAQRPQAGDARIWRHKLASHNKTLFKIAARLTGDYSGSGDTYNRPADELTGTNNLFASIARLLYHVGGGRNRP
ncbi:MAG: hypothetical protein GY906_22460 [bacterium]|nr:hypothetical protein [bacterium]